jgi:membrane fusion protein (multidrug efflux system)
MMTPRNILILVALVAVLGAGYWWFFTGEGGGDEERGGRQPSLVTVAPVATREFVDVIEAVGTAKAKESIDLTAKSAETVGAVNFTDGQKVGAGFVVAEMTSREQSADLAAMRAELSEASKAFERMSELSGKGFATKAQLDAAVSARDSAAARVKSLESRVTDRLIKAPFAGVLGLRKVSVGTLVKPGDIITTLDDVSLIKLDFTVPESFLGALKMGMPVRAQVAAYPGRVFEGTVAGIDSRVDPISRSVAMRAEIPNKEDLLLPGMLMTVSLLKNQRQVLAVAEQSLVPVEDRQYVYVVSADMKAERREVKTGARQPGFVEVLSGVKAGEQVVVDGTIRLRPGGTVRLQGSEDEKPDGKKKRGPKGGGGAAAAGTRT